MRTVLIIAAIWFAIACIAGPIIGRILKTGRGPRNGGQK